MIMNKEILYEILNSKSETLSSAEIESILNEELDKSPQEMDTDLVDLCLEALNTVDEKKLNNRKKKYRLSKILIAAALFALIIGISIPVCAKYLNVNVPEGIVTFYNDCFKIDISNNEYVYDIAAQLTEDGISDVILPRIIFSPETRIYNYDISNSPYADTYKFEFCRSDYDGLITIQVFNSGFDFATENTKTASKFENVEYFEINEIPIVVFGADDISYIQYVDDNIEYNIQIHCNYESACQIAKTL